MFERMWHHPDRDGDHHQGGLAGWVVAERRRLDAAEVGWLRRVAWLEASGEWRRDGHTSLTAFLADRAGMAPGKAAQAVELSRSLKSASGVWEAVESGQLSLDQARVLASAAMRFPAEFKQAESVLVTEGQRLTVRQLRRLIQHWSQALQHREGDLEEPPSQVYLSRGVWGRGHLIGELTSFDTEVVSTALTAVMDDLRRNSEEHRPAAELRGQALVEICRRFLDAGEAPTSGGERPHINVVITLEELTGVTRWGGDYCPSGEVCDAPTIDQLLCDASVRRIVLSPRSEVIDVGRNTRVIPTALRAAVTARDRHCAFPGCDRPPSWCDCHHITPWNRGGPTTEWNLILLCRRHHQLVHRGWTIQHHPQGGITFHRPDGSLLAHRPFPTRPPAPP